MSTGSKIIEGAKEALAIAKGEQPAAAIWHKGHKYVPEAEERIAAAAVRYQGMTFSMPPPARHGECILLMLACRQDIDRNATGAEEQGFVTSRNRFVDRVEARKIAVAANQLTWRDAGLDELFSEDVW